MSIEVTMDSKSKFLGTTISNPWKSFACKKGLFVFFPHREIVMGMFLTAELLKALYLLKCKDRMQAHTQPWKYAGTLCLTHSCPITVQEKKKMHLSGNKIQRRNKSFCFGTWNRKNPTPLMSSLSMHLLPECTDQLSSHRTDWKYEKGRQQKLTSCFFLFFQSTRYYLPTIYSIHHTAYRTSTDD